MGIFAHGWQPDIVPVNSNKLRRSPREVWNEMWGAASELGKKPSNSAINRLPVVTPLREAQPFTRAMKRLIIMRAVGFECHHTYHPG